MSVKTDEIQLHFSDSGLPMFMTSKQAKVALSVCDGDAPNLREVAISGNPAGLKALGAYLIALAQVPDFHSHFDETVNGTWFRCDQGYTLTLENQARGNKRS